MRKALCLLLICMLLAATLSACSNRQADETQTAANGNFAPEVTAVPESDTDVQTAANALSGNAMTDPTLEPVETLPPAEGGGIEADIFGEGEGVDSAHAVTHDAPSNIDTSTYDFSVLSDESLGYSFQYPSHWQYLPGVYTVCFREIVEEGDFPARVAITRNKLVHTPSESTITDQLISYLKTIATQYEDSTFEVDSLDKSTTFMGQQGYATTYLAFSGEIEVKGYVIMCAVERTLYVYHFCASYADYQSMESMMQHMRNSVTLTAAE